MGVNIWEGNKADRLVKAAELIAINAAGGIDSDPGFDGIAQLVISGMGKRALPVGTQIVVGKETAITASHTGSGITGITVNEEAFINAEHSSVTKAYEFTFDGVGWKDQNGDVVELSAYGISITGTPANDDIIAIHETAANIEMSVLDHDYDAPADTVVEHTMTIGMNNCYENRQYDAPEALVYCPEGLIGNQRYYVTCDHAGYGGHTTEDGSYGFTPTVSVGNVRYVRHETIGVWASSYSQTRITNGKFITYDANFTKLEECATSTGTDGTSLGTTTAEDPSYKVGDNVNFSSRNAYGSNDWETSNIRQYLNSIGTGWWKQQTKWDFPPADVATLKGFLTGIDPALRAHMQPVKKRYARHAASGGGYVDTVDKVFLLGMTEVDFGQNNSVYESSLGLNNTIKTVPYAYYTDAGNVDRIKLLNSSSRYWWLRGSYPSSSDFVRFVYTDGSLSLDSAYFAYGLVAACVIG